MQRAPAAALDRRIMPGGLPASNPVTGGRQVGMVVQDGATTTTRYFHLDHLDSIHTITNETGGIVERLSYDAWGKRRAYTGALRTRSSGKSRSGVSPAISIWTMWA